MASHSTVCFTYFHMRLYQWPLLAGPGGASRAPRGKARTPGPLPAAHRALRAPLPLVPVLGLDMACGHVAVLIGNGNDLPKLSLPGSLPGRVLGSAGRSRAARGAA